MSVQGLLTTLLEWPWKFGHVYFLPDKEQNLIDGDFDSSQVENTKIEIVMVMEQIK